MVIGLVVLLLDVWIVGWLGLCVDVWRVLLFGLGCVVGVVGVVWLYDYLCGVLDGVVVLVLVELCLFMYLGYKLMLLGFVGSVLFVDGVVVVVVVGVKCVQDSGVDGLDILDLCSYLYFDLLCIMGYDVGLVGFEFVLLWDLVVVVEQYLGNDVIIFLVLYGLSIIDVGVWVIYFGGFKIINVIIEIFDLLLQVFELMWCLLGEIGNLLLVLVLYVLCDIIVKLFFSGSFGLMIVMGLGFCFEFVLLCWY